MLNRCSVIQQLYERAHEYANLANRAKPVVTDLLSASEDYNLEPSEIRRLTKKSRKRKRGASSSITFQHPPFQSVFRLVTGGESPVALLPPPPRPPSPELLSPDEEGVPPSIPVTLRPLPHYVPPLPPKHTYLRTPVSTNRMVD